MKKNLFILLASLLVIYSLTTYIYAAGSQKPLSNVEKTRIREIIATQNPKTFRADINDLINDLEKNSGPMVGIGLGLAETQSGNNLIVSVAEVLPGKPAEKAGVKVGDVIYSLNGKSLISREAFLAEYKGDGKPGHEVKLGIIRDNQKLEISMKTAIIREDRSVEAGGLKDFIQKKGADLFSRYDAAVVVALKALDSPLINIDDPVLLAIDDVTVEFDRWLSKMRQTVFGLLEVK